MYRLRENMQLILLEAQLPQRYHLKNTVYVSNTSNDTNSLIKITCLFKHYDLTINRYYDSCNKILIHNQ